MKTATEMYEYIKENKFHRGVASKSWARKGLKIVEANIQSEEGVQMAFIGTIMYVPSWMTDDRYVCESNAECAFAVTNKRLIIAAKGIRRDFIKILLLDSIKKVSLKPTLLFKQIEFNIDGRYFIVRIDERNQEAILSNIKKALA